MVDISHLFDPANDIPNAILSNGVSSVGRAPATPVRAGNTPEVGGSSPSPRTANASSSAVEHRSTQAGGRERTQEAGRVSAGRPGERVPGSNPTSRVTLRERLGRPECPYLERWAIDFGRLGSVRLYHWIASDDDRAKHDHPSDFITLVLKGSYTDVSYEAAPDDVLNGDAEERMTPGTIRRRKAEHRHWVRVAPGGCWTLLYFWPKRRNWGFFVPRGDGFKFKKSNKYFLEHGDHPCELNHG